MTGAMKRATCIPRFSPSVPPSPAYTQVAGRDIMDQELHPDLYMLANEMIARYGAMAGEYASDMLRCRLDDGDLLAAGLWLAIGNAIEDLARLEAGETRH